MYFYCKTHKHTLHLPTVILKHKGHNHTEHEQHIQTSKNHSGSTWQHDILVSSFQTIFLIINIHCSLTTQNLTYAY